MSDHTHSRLSLADLSTGDHARVVSVEEASETARRRLRSLGIIPGEEVILEQRVPTYVVRVGHTRVALDWETARCVEVVREET